MSNPFKKSAFHQAAAPLNPEFLQHVTSCLILAPHPDDESLGCGGLIALLRARNCQVTVMVTTDGSQSHPNSLKFLAKDRIALRRNEIINALDILGVDEKCIHFLNGRDAGLPDKQMAGFEGYKNQIKYIIEKVNPQLCLVPYELDPHCDHRSTWQLLDAALADVKNNGITVWEYPIWLYQLAQPADIPQLNTGELIAVDISNFLEQKRNAIYTHVSQVGNLIDDDPAGFTLSEDMIGNFLTGMEYFMQRDALKKEATLQADYFRHLYQSNPDPWSFETSEYEQQKYQDTINHLPKQHYQSALEIGCSIGVLTYKLQSRCGHLLAIDITETAIQTARKRLKNQPHVSFEVYGIPGQFPDGKYDLVVMSEVGYYLSMADLALAKEKIVSHLHPGGTLILVHWTHYVVDYPLTGDQVHQLFLDERKLENIQNGRTKDYRLDVFIRRADEL